MLSSRICVQQDFRDQQTAPWMISKPKQRGGESGDMKDDSSQKTQLTHLLRDGYCDDDDSSDSSSYYSDSDDDSEYSTDLEEIEHEMLGFDLQQMRRRKSTSSTLSTLSALTANSAENRPSPSQAAKQLCKAFSATDLFERMAKANATNSYFQDVNSTTQMPTQRLSSSSSSSKHHHRNTIATSRPSTLESASRPDQYLKIMLESEYTTESTFESKTWEKYFTAVTQERMDAHNLLVASTIRKGNLQELRRLASQGNRLDGCNRQGESNIHLACRLTHHGKDHCLEIVKFLLEEANVSIRVRDDCGRTPLHDACWTTKPNFHLIRYVLEKSPELLFLEDFRGYTALHYIPSDAWELWRDWIDNHHEWLQQRVHNSTWLKVSEDLDAAQLRLRRLMERAQSFMNSDSE